MPVNTAKQIPSAFRLDSATKAALRRIVKNMNGGNTGPKWTQSDAVRHAINELDKKITATN